jgi:ribosomal protein S12 methylthiotransferase
MKKPKVYLLSLGCPKNLVDSELILGALEKRGFVIKNEPRDVDIAIINTCAFIKEAKEESIDEIFGLIKLKKAGYIKRLVVSGCLPQRYMCELRQDLKEVDDFVGVEGWRHINTLLESIKEGAKYSDATVHIKPLYHDTRRHLLTPVHYAYVKISEGCDNFCSYCSIPAIRGRLRSRPIEEIKKEVIDLARNVALKEINLIAQDTTLYGRDLYGRARLVDLLKELDRIKKITWIRLLYAHPAHFSKELVEFIGSSHRICRYVDLPLQHISDSILKKMNRKVSKKKIYELISSLRKEIPDVSLRTSFIVGFPGESNKDFNELIKFVKEIRFEHLGAFMYSCEENTRASGFKNQVPEKVKKERYDILLEVQREISRNVLKGYVGRNLKVLVDEKLPDSDNTYLGRTEFDAPEVDGSVVIKDKGIKEGDLINARITDTWEYDLLAERA